MADHLVKTLQEGLKNEFDGALNYTFLASKTGDIDLRKRMLTYAKNEIEHALKLLDLLGKLEEGMGDLSPELVNPDDIMDFMIHYQAKEEGAVFYYNLLVELLDEPREQEIFKKISAEETEHYNFIKSLVQKLI